VITFVKELTIREIIADTLYIYGKHFPLLFLICLVPFGPFEILESIGISTQNSWLLVMSNVLYLFAGGVFAYGAMTVAVSDICLGNRPSLKRSYSAIGRVPWKYLGAYLLMTVIVGAGLYLLILPGILVGALLVFTLPAVIIERKGSIAALKRSLALGKGFYWHNLGVLTLATLITLVVAFVASTVIYIAAVLAGARAEDFATSLLMSLGSILAAPLLQIPLILLYYDMRVRKEFFDGAALAQEMFA
jgi:hypothetical protein